MSQEKCSQECKEMIMCRYIYDIFIFIYKHLFFDSLFYDSIIFTDVFVSYRLLTFDSSNLEQCDAIRKLLSQSNEEEENDAWWDEDF